ncbi:MAG TPA: ribbon-helix-helix domain-containing protein [Candidatus Norongarragalinales archaeon]|nr:ribbon-helix-helix domain-containing protein [Candidatus Norongarragalinales archaeon]
MVNVSVDLAPAQLKFLRELLAEGQYRSRSEAVRDFIRRAEFAWEWGKAIEESKDKSIDFEKEREAVSKKLLKRFA